MKYTVQRGEPVSEEIKRIIDGKVETGIEHIDSDADRHETVHEVRKRCKEVRAALRLVRPVLPTYSEENAHYRDAARRVSEVRDAQAAIETFDDHVRPAAEDDGALSDGSACLTFLSPPRATTQSRAVCGNPTSGHATGWKRHTRTPSSSGSTSGANG